MTTGHNASAVALDENIAVLVEPDGIARISGNGRAYFFEAAHRPEVCRPGKPLTLTGVHVQRVSPGNCFHFKTWDGEAESYSLSVVDGIITPSTSDGHLY